MVVNNTIPKMYGKVLLIVVNTSCPRMFEVPYMASVAVDYSFPCEASLVGRENIRLEVRHVYNLVQIPLTGFHALGKVIS